MGRHSDGVAFSSSDSKTLVEELEKSLITTLMEYMTHWKRYADDTIAVIKLASTENVRPTLNTFDQNTKFTYELEQKLKIKFLDVLLIRTNDTLQTKVPIIASICTGNFLNQKLGNFVCFRPF